MFWEIWGALVHGASCHMVEIRNALDPNIFSRFIIDHQISILFLTPALFAQFAVACFDALQTVRYICFGGDKLTQCGVLKKFADKGVTIANLYGPSECSGWCTKYEAVVSTQSTGAIIKAGGAYVPLDPTYPESRLEFVIEDTRAQILITETRTRPVLERFFKPENIIEMDSMDFTKYSKANPPHVATPTNLIWIVYTSGSTGKPKGVCVEQKSILNVILNTNFFTVNPEDAFAVTSNIGFDVMFWEIWGALVHGASCHMVEIRNALDPNIFSRFIIDHQISILFLTPALFAQFAVACFDALQTVRYICFGGDKLTQCGVLKKFADKGVTIANLYGPSECSGWCTKYVLKEEELHSPPPALSIGTPVSRVSIFLLDPRENLVGVGVVGELCIGGVCVSRGYLNLPEMTARKFIKNKFVESEYKIYKTGDLARYLPDGNIEFLGRRDYQVKLHGYRIELGEIEKTVCSYGIVKDCVTVLSTDERGENFLIAYVATIDGSTDGKIVQDLNAFLVKMLPNYMVPKFLVLLPRLPLNSNGKVERKLLPPPPQNDVQEIDSSPQRMTTMELQIAEMFSSLLGVSPVKLDHDFFQLGGHSLLLFQLLLKVRANYPCQISVPDIYAHSTVESLACFITKQLLNPLHTTSSVFKITHIPNTPILFLLPPGYGTSVPYFIFSDFKKFSIYGLNDPNLGKEEGFSDITEMAQYYVQQIRQYQPTGPYLLGGWSLGGNVALEMAHLLLEEGQTTTKIIMFDAINISSVSPEVAELLKNEDVDLFHLGTAPEIQRFAKSQYKKAVGYMLSLKPRTYDGKVILLKALTTYQHAVVIEEQMKNLTEDNSNGWGKLLPNLEIILQSTSHSDMLNHDNLAVLEREISRLVD
eukprot:TRINITY_DN3075_c0_g1_i12.p1 TRINITY_DN3075_c0_g1~~TRINITY_DN3075_c0_g1_i12.p1  ORF type:complete len:875 (+),score=172.75 TRINITY_DN3075_c0_g1_i12:262-2886(+)